MATFIIKYTWSHDRVVIIESENEESAKLLGSDDTGVVISEYSESDEVKKITKIDEIQFKDVV